VGGSPTTPKIYLDFPGFPTSFCQIQRNICLGELENPRTQELKNSRTQEFKKSGDAGVKGGKPNQDSTVRMLFKLGVSNLTLQEEATAHWVWQSTPVS
jgi:hypothetical protein